MLVEHVCGDEWLLLRGHRAPAVDPLRAPHVVHPDEDAAEEAERGRGAVVQLEDWRVYVGKVARWQNLIPSFPWIAPGWRLCGRNPRKGRDQIMQRSHSPEARRAKHIRSKNLAIAIWQP